MRLSLIVAGDPPFERGTNFEPSLLPHLARLCHDFSVGEVIAAAKLFGPAKGHFLGWPELWESTFATLVSRFPDATINGQLAYQLDPIEIETYRFLATRQGDPSLLKDRIRADALFDRLSLLARVTAASPDANSIRDFVAATDADDVDAEGIRRLLTAAHQLSVTIDRAWIDRALGRDGSWSPASRVAHILPSLPSASERAVVAREVMERINQESYPAWYFALAASRLAPYLSKSAQWDLTRLTPEESPWIPFVEGFANKGSVEEQGAAETLAADVLRAHLFGADLTAIEGPHETTDPVAREIMFAWGGAPAAAASDAGDGDGDEDGDGDDVMAIAGEVDARYTPTEDNRQLGVDAFLDGTRLRHALIANLPTVLEVSVAPEGEVEIQTGVPIELDFDDRDRRSLPVRLVHDETEQWATMHVLRDPTARSAVSFDVTPAGDEFSALIVLYSEDKATVIEAALYTTAVVPTVVAQESSAPTMRLNRVPARALNTPTGEPTGSVVTDGRQTAVAAGEVAIRATPMAAADGPKSVTKNFETASKNYVALDGAYDITSALIEAGKWGYRTRNRLGLAGLGTLASIQVVSFNPGSVFPLELIYDGEPPDDNARLCDGWKEALQRGACAKCTDPNDTATICPMRFWGMSKVIEHHVGTTTGNLDFVARRHFVEQLTTLPMLSAAVIGASNEVLKELAGQAAVTASAESVLHALAVHVRQNRRAVVVNGWQQWRSAIEKEDPDLLIAMPHQDSNNHAPALELGGEFETTFVEGHVRRRGDEPGPLVFLLGCDTSTAADLIGSFASDMRRYSPVVIATIGKVVAKEAPIVAAKIIDSLRSVTLQPGNTVGEALLKARRALLADSRLVGLLLVGHGDARWEVQP